MMAELILVPGDTTWLEFTIDTAIDENGNPIADLAGTTFRFQARTAPDAPTPVFSKSSTTGGIVVTGMTVRVRIDPADLSSVPPNTMLVADLEAQRGGATYTIRIGNHPQVRLRVLEEVTR